MISQPSNRGKWVMLLMAFALIFAQFFSGVALADDDNRGIIYDNERETRLTDSDFDWGNSGGAGNYPGGPGPWAPPGAGQPGHGAPGNGVPGADSPGSGVPGSGGDGDGFWSGLWNGITETGSAIIEGGADLWDGFTSWTADKWNSVTSWTADTWNSFTGWVGDVWDSMPTWVQNLIKTIGVIVAVVAVIALLVVGGVITLVVGVVAAIGAAIAALVYFALNANSEDFNMLHSLLWATGGALVGGFGAALYSSGALAAGFTAVSTFVRTAGSLFANMVKRFVMATLISQAVAGWGFVAKFMAGVIAKAFAISAVTSLVFDLVPATITYIFTGEFNLTATELFTNALFAGFTGALTLGVAPAFKKATAIGKFGIAAFAGIATGSMAVIREIVTNGTASIGDFIIGATLVAVFVPITSKFISPLKNSVKKWPIGRWAAGIGLAIDYAYGKVKEGVRFVVDGVLGRHNLHEDPVNLSHREMRMIDPNNPPVNNVSTKETNLQPKELIDIEDEYYK